MFGGKGGLGNLMKQAQEMQKICKRRKKRLPEWKCQANPVEGW